MTIFDLLIIWLINAAAIGISAFILPGISVENYATALLASVVLALVNTFVRPFISFFSIPITILTFGLFIFVINALMVELTAMIVPGFKVRSFWSALIFSVILTLINSALFYFIY